MSWLRASAALRLEPGPATQSGGFSPSNTEHRPSACSESDSVNTALSGECVCVHCWCVKWKPLKTGPLYFFVECNSC